ncbi:multiprotein-bridging factor 1 family protein [Roseivirga sp. BDSF3-8]|uniref:helix-turn-helix domain-containing protein n=1 Tax=Roseivirga sp. BDSF3-8 TaxID=3241598 RepID=UPI003531ABDF
MEAVTIEAKLFVYARKQLGLGQRGMAMRLGVNQSSISKIESGVHRPRVSTIRKLERLMRLPAEHLACLAMGKSAPAPKPELSAAAKETKVIRLNARYRTMDTEALEYLKAKYYVGAYELDRKANRASYVLTQKELKHKLHRLNMDALEQQHKEAADLHAHLQSTNAPANLQASTQKRLDKASSELTAQRYYGINILHATKLVLEQMKIDEMRLKADLYRSHMSQVENVLHHRKPLSAKGEGKVVAMTVSRTVYREVL